VAKNYSFHHNDRIEVEQKTAGTIQQVPYLR